MATPTPTDDPAIFPLHPAPFSNFREAKQPAFVACGSRDFVTSTRAIDSSSYSRGALFPSCHENAPLGCSPSGMDFFERGKRMLRVRAHMKVTSQRESMRAKHDREHAEDTCGNPRCR